MKAATRVSPSYYADHFGGLGLRSDSASHAGASRSTPEEYLANGTLALQSKQKTRTVSFRIYDHIWSALEQESRRLAISLNCLVSQILDRYISWGRMANELNFLPASKGLLREAFGALEPERVEAIAKKLGETHAHEEILFLFQELNPRAVLRFIELWSSHFDAAQHRYDGRRHFFTIRHDVNLNFSFFAKEYVYAMIQSTISRDVQFATVSPNSVTFSFEG